MDWDTYYAMMRKCSLWIEREGDRWNLYFAPRSGGNWFLGSAATPQDCAHILWSGQQFPQGAIKLASVGVS